MPQYKVKSKQVEALRTKHRVGLVEGEREKLGPNSMMTMYKKDPSKYRSIFLSKFFLHSGIQKTVMSSDLFVNKFHKAADILDYLTCKPDWAMCLFDFGFGKTLPQFYAYRVRDMKQALVDDYFFGDDKDRLISNERSMAFPSISVKSEERQTGLNASPFM